MWVTIAEVSVWNVSPILQGLARSILSRSIAAVCGLGDTFDDVHDTADGMPVKRSDTTGWIGHFHHGEFPIIAAGQWKTFENLARDTLKSKKLFIPILEVSSRLGGQTFGEPHRTSAVPLKTGISDPEQHVCFGP